MAGWDNILDCDSDWMSVYLLKKIKSTSIAKIVNPLFEHPSPLLGMLEDNEIIQILNTMYGQYIITHEIVLLEFIFTLNS